MSRNIHVNPIFAPLLHAIAGSLPDGPLEPAAQPRAPIAKGLRSPAARQYQLLVELTAVHAPPEGYSEAVQLPPLTNRSRGVILRANPDALNDFNFEPDELAEVLEGSIDARLWVSACTEGALRRRLFLDVAAQLEADAEILRQNAADPELRRSDFL